MTLAMVGEKALLFSGISILTTKTREKTSATLEIKADVRASCYSRTSKNVSNYGLSI